MSVRVAINGFGRIGRLVLRALLEKQRPEIEVVALNDLGSPESSLHLFQYDSVHGSLPLTVNLHKEGSESYLQTPSQKIKIVSEPNPEKLPWGEMQVDVVLECSGRFTSREKAEAHLRAGAKKVLISAPAENVDKTVVFGVNHLTLKPTDRLVSNASCTTNCLAPVASVLQKTVGLVHGYMTTIHAYTGDQSLVDMHHPDPRRARAAALSMIPSTTGAAKAVGLVIPELQGKLDGTAIRVPVPNVSLVDLTFVASRPTTPSEINGHLEEAAAGSLAGILAINALPLVSTDFNHNQASSIFDTTQTQVVDGVFCRVLSWYDNEWGFSNRMGDVAALMGKLG
ncbi:MAG: type I glyceraldehyde-3-phosphate dehydrogenase [Alphaproteobacteria bacterium]